MTVICDVDPAGAETLHSALGTESVLVPTVDALQKHLTDHPEEDVVVLGAGVDLLSAARLAETMRVTRPSLGVVLVRRRLDTSVLSDALRAGVREVVEERDVAGVATGRPSGRGCRPADPRADGRRGRRRRRPSPRAGS